MLNGRKGLAPSTLGLHNGDGQKTIDVAQSTKAPSAKASLIKPKALSIRPLPLWGTLLVAKPSNTIHGISAQLCGC